MKLFSLPLAIAMAFALPSAPAQAQASAPLATAAASAPRPTKPARRLLTPEQARQSATAPGELRPERQVAPQIVIPLTKKPQPPTNPNLPRKGKATPSGGIDDAVARCEAQSDPQARARCRATPASSPRSP